MNDPKSDHEARICELLLAWEESRAAGHPRSAADLCRHAPQLVERLQGEINRLRAIEHFMRGDGSGRASEAE